MIPPFQSPDDLGTAWKPGTPALVADRPRGRIAAREQALNTGSPDEGDRAIALTNLGIGLLDRHYRTGSQADLDAAIAAYEEAVEIGPDDPPARRSIRTTSEPD